MANLLDEIENNYDRTISYLSIGLPILIVFLFGLFTTDGKEYQYVGILLGFLAFFFLPRFFLIGYYYNRELVPKLKYLHLFSYLFATYCHRAPTTGKQKSTFF